MDNLLNPQFGVSALAEELGISRSELYRRIKEAEQKSASQFIREIRLERALELLKSDEYSITEIAYMVGFNSPTYFSTCFKEYYGYSPSTADQNGHTSADAAPSKPSRSRKILLPLILGAMAILVAAFGLSGVGAGRAAEEEKSLAVLKFDYLGADTANSYMAHTLADEVLNSLSNLSDLRVVASSTSFDIDKREACSKIGRRLGVKYLVDGSISDVDNRLKATVKLIDAREGHQLWARSFESDSGEFAILQNTVSAEVIDNFKSYLYPAAGSRPTEGRRPSLQALALYQEAVALGEERNADSLKHAIGLLNEAIRLDPGFAEAYAEVSYLSGQSHFYGGMSREERDIQMRENIERAEALDPESPEVLFARADFDYKLGDLVKDSSKVIAQFRKIQQMDPGNARYNYRLYQVLRDIRQDQAAHQYLENAARLSPENGFYKTILARDVFWKQKEREKGRELIDEVLSKGLRKEGVYFKALMLADQPTGDLVSAFRLIDEARKERPYLYGFLYWGTQMALELDLTPVAHKYSDLVQVRFPSNPIYTFELALKVLLFEKRFQDAIDLTTIWIQDKKLDGNMAAAVMARIHYLKGDYRKSREILEDAFADLFAKIENGAFDVDEIPNTYLTPLRNSSLSCLRTYNQLLRHEGSMQRAAVFADFLCAYYEYYDFRLMHGEKYDLMECYYLQDDLENFLDVVRTSFFETRSRFGLYSSLKSSRYAAFEKYPEYQALFSKIEAEIHRQRSEVISYLKEAGSWDPAWDAALQ